MVGIRSSKNSKSSKNYIYIHIDHSMYSNKIRYDYFFYQAVELVSGDICAFHFDNLGEWYGCLWTQRK